MKLLPLLLLISTMSFAQATVADIQKKIVGYWAIQKLTTHDYTFIEEMVFYNNGEYVAGNQKMRCQGSWTIQSIEKQGLILSMTSSKACGSEEQSFFISSISKDKLQLQHPSQESDADIIFYRQDKKPWKKAKMLKEVLGVWERPSRREPNKKSVALILQKDSFYMKEGGEPIMGAWELSQDGRYIVLKFAEEPMVSIYAAAPGHFILPLSQKENKWAAQMEKDSIHKAKNGSTAKKLQKKIIGTWEAKEADISFKQEYKKDGTALFSISRNLEEGRSVELKWRVSEEGKYIIITNPKDNRKSFELCMLSKDNNGQVQIKKGRTIYTKTK